MNRREEAVVVTFEIITCDMRMKDNQWCRLVTGISDHN
jgi:hypothetical protein